jgi:hypothetical protein
MYTNKIKYLLAIAVSALLLGGCTVNNNDIVSPDSFTISVTPLTGDSLRKNTTNSGVDTLLIHKNDVVNFKFGGSSVDQILFYNGEAGFEYRYHSRYVADTLDYKNNFAGNFRSSISIITALAGYSATQTQNHSLMASDNLATYTKAALKSANWAALIPSLRYKADGTNETAPALNLPLSWLMKDSVQLAIVSKTSNPATNQLTLPSATNVFTIYNYETRDYSGFGFPGVKTTLTHKIVDTFDQAFWGQCNPDSTAGVLNNQDYKFNVGDLGKSGRSYTDSLNYNSNHRKIQLVYPITMMADTVKAKAIATTATVPFEAWLLMRKYNPRQVFPDVPTTYVKTKEMNSVISTSYTYKNLGVFKASFVAMNTGINDTKFVVREMVIIVR